MNIDGPDLEDRYRRVLRVLRLLPGYYRATWEEDMVAAFLDSRMTGDEEEDEYTFEFGKPTWPEVASVAALAARLYLGGAGTPLRYFAWGQAVRGAVLAVLPPSLMIASPSDGWPTVWNTIDDAPSGHSESPGESGLLITLPATDVAALTAVTTRVYDARGAVDISVAGKTWGLPMQLTPLTHGQFAIVLPSSGQTRQLQRLLVPSS